MTTRDKLIKAMHRADLSGFQRLFALAIYDEHGPAHAYQYVNQATIDKKLEAYK